MSKNQAPVTPPPTPPTTVVFPGNIVTTYYVRYIRAAGGPDDGRKLTFPSLETVCQDLLNKRPCEPSFQDISGRYTFQRIEDSGFGRTGLLVFDAATGFAGWADLPSEVATPVTKKQLSYLKLELEKLLPIQAQALAELSSALKRFTEVQDKVASCLAEIGALPSKG